MTRTFDQETPKRVRRRFAQQRRHRRKRGGSGGRSRPAPRDLLARMDLPGFGGGHGKGEDAVPPTAEDIWEMKG
jgi:hypothetical protein